MSALQQYVGTVGTSVESVHIRRYVGILGRETSRWRMQRLSNSDKRQRQHKYNDVTVSVALF